VGIDVPAGLLIDGEWIETQVRHPVVDKYTNEAIGEVDVAAAEHVTRAVTVADRAQRDGPLAPYDRYTILTETARLLEARSDAFIRTIVAETGFTVSDAERDLRRCLETLAHSGEEAKRIVGEIVPIEGAPAQQGRMAFTMRVPVGVVAAITPFNSPLNTVAHKVGPALAAGNAVVVKPATATPLTAAMLCQALLDAGLPPGLIGLLHGPGGTVGRWLVSEPAVRFITFTGSTEVGLRIQSAAGIRRTQMELGSIACTIVCADADLDRALPKIVDAGFRKAGQVCTSLQRLYIARERFAELRDLLKTAVSDLKAGDPRDPATSVGPMISESEAQRAEDWCNEAVASGANLLVGGMRDGPVFHPTLIEKAPAESRVLNQEVFAPVVSLLQFDDLSEAIDEVNDTPFGLAAGIFTAALDGALVAARRLHVGSLHVNETCSTRVDLMPYGGLKQSGFGHEGPRYAIRELTEERLITISPTSRA